MIVTKFQQKLFVSVQMFDYLCIGLFNQKQLDNVKSLLYMVFKCSFLLGLLLLTPCNKISSQVLLTKDAIGFEEGDFTRNKLDYFNPGDGGQNCLWDFSDLEIPRSSHSVIQRTDSLERMVMIDDKQMTYYMMRGDSLMEIGNENPLKETYYYKPLCSMIYPMTYEDSFSKDFEGYGIYCGNHFFKEVGVCNVIVDGQGDIVLSETDTLKNALRVYKLKSYSIAMDVDPSKIDSAQLKQVIEEKYEWYVRGYNKPILESVTSTSYANLSPIGTTQYAYCCLPDNQSFNEDNLSSEDDNGNDGQNTSNIPKDIIHYTVTVEGGVVNIEYSLDAKANVTMLISNQLGVIYSNKRFTQDAGTGYHADFNIAGLRPGVYVLYINVNGKVYHETIRK